MNIFLKTNYQVILREVVAERKELDSRFNFQAMAVATRIPKSYLSKVKSGDAHLNGDQMFLVCKYLGFDATQTRYMMLLLEHARSGLQQRRDEIAREIQQMQGTAMETKAHLQSNPATFSEQTLNEYYLDPLNQLVHMALLLPAFKGYPAQLAAALDISNEELMQILQKLENLGIIEKHRQKIRVNIEYLHLPRHASVYKVWRNAMRLHCLQHLNRERRARDYSFSATFSGSWEVKNLVQAEFLSLVKKLEKLSSDCPQEDIFQINFDLFSWLANGAGPES